jgi:DNA-binding transcriptional regulator GbsR (MarR family)
MSNTEENARQPMPLIGGARPIVIDGGKKKKKRKYSKGLKDLQVSARRTSAISSDLTRAVAKGVRAYRKASSKSAEKKRDGALRDMGRNIAKGISKSLRKSSDVPYDLAKALETRGLRRSRRRATKALARLGRMVGAR